MAKPKARPRTGQFGHSSKIEIKHVLPSTILIEPSHVFSELYGGECGMGQYMKTGGPSICEHKLTVEVLDRKGAAYYIYVNCPNVNHSRNFWTSGQDESGTFNVNKYIAVAGRVVGFEFTKTREFMCALGTRIQSEKSYNAIANSIAVACSTMAAKSKIVAAATLRTAMGIVNWAGETVDVVLACDGSWLTRGQKSRHGVATGLSALTHQVLDTEVESTYCTICSTQLLPDPALVHECHITHKGSAGAMEISGLRKIFQRAPELLNFREAYSHE